MNRRFFAQSLGGATLLSAMANVPAWTQGSDAPSAGQIMAIAAHPGDGMFTMGSLLARQIDLRASGVLLSLSRGERGAPKNITVEQYGDMQQAATEKATQLLGANAIFLPYPDAEIPNSEESALRVCDAIREHKPDMVVTHWKGSWHKDHENCHHIVRNAIFYAGLGTLARNRPPHSVSKTFYAENWEDADGFVPDTYVNIESVYQKWLEACALFPMWRGQTGFRYNDYYSSVAVMRGCLSGFKQAVAVMSDASERIQRLQSL